MEGEEMLMGFLVALFVLAVPILVIVVIVRLLGWLNRTEDSLDSLDKQVKALGGNIEVIRRAAERLALNSATTQTLLRMQTSAVSVPGEKEEDAAAHRILENMVLPGIEAPIDSVLTEAGAVVFETQEVPMIPELPELPEADDVVMDC